MFLTFLNYFDEDILYKTKLRCGYELLNWRWNRQHTRNPNTFKQKKKLRFRKIVEFDKPGLSHTGFHFKARNISDLDFHRKLQVSTKTSSLSGSESMSSENEVHIFRSFDWNLCRYLLYKNGLISILKLLRLFLVSFLIFHNKTCRFKNSKV